MQKLRALGIFDEQSVLNDDRTGKKSDLAGIFEDQILLFQYRAGVFEYQILVFPYLAGIFEYQILIFLYRAGGIRISNFDIRVSHRDIRISPERGVFYIYRVFLA